MDFIKEKGPGIVVCIAIAAVATILTGFSIGSFSLEIVGAPVFAILMGMIVTMVAPSFASSDSMKHGVKFTSKKILQWAVIILGFSLNLSTIVKVGGQSLPVIVSTICTSLVVAYVMMKVLKMDSKTATLIGVGSSICGGSAIAATAPVIDADDETIAQSISVIFLFNVIAALIFPYIGYAIGFGSEGFAIFAGTAVNDTSSVTATAATAEGLYGVEGILSAAVTVKLTRTLAIIPITLTLAILRTRKAKKEGGEEGNNFSFKKIFPWFILYFIGASIITTVVGLMPASGVTEVYGASFVPAMKWLAKFFIAMAMCAIGLNTNLIKLIKNGAKPIAMGFCCWVMISVVSILVQHMTGIFYTNIM
ncbi:MAG: YeiH family putative sulfate export transporter [Clostridiales bacterium]|nr:YeiH family putative sulfate export transporter [Candidatus Crickella merdequi]